MKDKVIVRAIFKSNNAGAIYCAVVGLVCALACTIELAPYIVVLSVLLSIVMFYCAWLCYNTKNNELVITPQLIYGRVNRKTIELPVDSIASVETDGSHSIKIATASGVVAFNMCVNREEVFHAVSMLLGCRAKGVSGEVLYTLKIYRELLEDGTINSEEYYEKEKELLG